MRAVGVLFLQPLGYCVCVRVCARTHVAPVSLARTRAQTTRNIKAYGSHLKHRAALANGRSSFLSLFLSPSSAQLFF